MPINYKAVIIALATSFYAFSSQAAMEPFEEDELAKLNTSCNCHISIPENAVLNKGRTIMVWQLDKTVMLKVNGRLVKLESKNEADAQFPCSHKKEIHFQNDEIDIKGRCVLLSNHWEEAETVTYRATMAVKGIVGQQSVKAIVTCGC